MRILLINQFFWPDLAATSVLLTDLSRHLSESGHEITVLCGAAAYGGDDTSERPDVRILRAAAPKFGRSIPARLLCYTSFFVSSVWRAVTIARPDVVITMTTPPLVSLIGALMHKFRGTKHYVWEMDMYPDVAIDLGLLRASSPLARLIGFLSSLGRAHSDRVIALGECMQKRLLQQGVAPAKVVIAGNWADGAVFKPAERATRDRLTVVYTGNLGLGHDAETLASVMLALSGQSRLQFLFIGGGARMAWLERFCADRQITNAAFLPYASREKLNALLRDADIGLVSQDPRCVGSIVPSKFYSLAACGLPILYVGASHATPALLIDRFGCGWFSPSGDAKGIAALLRSLLEEPSRVRRCAHAARNAFLTNWDRPVALQHLTRVLEIPDARASAVSVAAASPASTLTATARCPIPGSEPGSTKQLSG